MAQENYVAPNIQPSSAAFSDLLAGGLAGILAKVVAANPALANPTQAPTVNPTGGGATGGSLPAGTYYAAYSYVDGAGETLTIESAQFTVAAGNIPLVTIPSEPAACCGCNLYLTQAGGASGSEALYATRVGPTFLMPYAGPTDPGIPIPTANTTGAASIAARLNAGASPNWRLAWERLSDLVSQYTSGDPVDFQTARNYISHFDYCFSLWHEVTKEVLTLIAGQAWSLRNVPTTTQNKVVRTFP